MSVRKKIKTIGWSALGLCCLVLLVAAMKTKGSKGCSAIDVNIAGTLQHAFVKKEDVMEVLNQNNIYKGELLDNINLKKAEEQLKQNAWINDAQLFIDNQQTLHINITEREPVARVFTIAGNSFYIDSSGLRLPVSENATARVIVFTSFPSDKKILSTPDSLVLNDIKTLAKYISADSFLNKQTAQVNITQQRTYEITPLVGNQIIKIGNADSLHEKFSKLITFYKQVFSKVGFEKYKVIDVQYEGQVVAVKKGESYTISDSAKALNQFAKADKKLNEALNDTTYSAPLIDSVKTASVTNDVKKTSAYNTSLTIKKSIKKNNSNAKSISSSNKKQQNKKVKAVMKKIRNDDKYETKETRGF